MIRNKNKKSCSFLGGFFFVYLGKKWGN
uniref:Uncharacterized protein n=1 Tax=Anguilla anguilla TaxID=7936 RepID=A0A0E9QHC5_ANGAN